MAKVLLINPWRYRDEGMPSYDSRKAWRNAPYGLLLLSAVLKKAGHKTQIADLERELVRCKGDVNTMLATLLLQAASWRPDIIGISMFSVHYLEVKRLVKFLKFNLCKSGIQPLIVVGGIHATIEPHASLEDLNVDYVFAGESEISFVKLADGCRVSNIQGLYAAAGDCIGGKGLAVIDLDSLPYPDWGQCDYLFYSAPSISRMRKRVTSSLDIMMGRGCVNKCGFCAYGQMSSVRFYSVDYIIAQMEKMFADFDITQLYFTDSSIGNSSRHLIELCEKILRNKRPIKFRWMANIRADQVDEELLKLMKRAGCEFLFYGFESGSDRILSAMKKGCTVEQNVLAAQLHYKLGFPYLASFIVGYPGEREEDMMATVRMIKKIKAYRVGVNCYVPLPGSPDYYKMLESGSLHVDDPFVWRAIGEVNSERVYAEVSACVYQKYLGDALLAAQEQALRWKVDFNAVKSFVTRRMLRKA